MKRLAVAALAIAFSVSMWSLAAQQQGGVETRPPNAPEQTPAFPGQTRAPEHKTNAAFDVVAVAENLQTPWGMVFLPDGRMLVTEKGSAGRGGGAGTPARMRILGKDGAFSAPLDGLPAVDARGQGGLLDVAIDPNFASNRLVYWSFSEPQPDGTTNTAAARGRLVEGATPRVENVQVIFHQTPSWASTMHYGSRLVFGRDGTLFVTMGERSVPTGRVQAQDLGSLLGKIARINPDGSVPKDNPFVGRAGAKPEIWSSGHRNIQGAALHPDTGELWEVEHGAQGGDELNIARKGRDYGWPTITYGEDYGGAPIGEGLTQMRGMEQPIYYWDPVIAPGNMMFYTGSAFPAWRGSLFIGGLASTHLVRLTLNGERVVGEERLLTDLQPARERIRDVRQGPDGAIYVLTVAAPRGPAGRLLKLVPRQSN
jgi:glucose/arabinose dehydrogenase